MKILIILTICVVVIGSVFFYQSQPAGAETAAVAPCANHNADASKRYLGGRMINHET